MFRLYIENVETALDSIFVVKQWRSRVFFFWQGLLYKILNNFFMEYPVHYNLLFFALFCPFQKYLMRIY